MEEQKVTLVVNAQDYNVILAGLSELPHKHSAATINNLVRQMQEQLNPDGTPKVEPIKQDT